MTIKEVFSKAENGTLTLEQFNELTKDSKYVDLSEGKYVSKQKYDDELGAKDKQIEDLNTTLSNRDTDLDTLKKQLEEAGTDTAKLTELTSKFNTLQGQYDSDTKAYQDKLNKQAYEFAVKEFANGKKFTSNAAKRDFISSLISENLKLDDNNSIMGANDFVTKYSETNEDAFLVDKEPEPQATPTPSFVAPTQGTQIQTEEGFGFNFIGVRPHEDN